MRIGIYLAPNNWSGGGRYLRNLLEALLSIDKRNDYFVYLEEAPGIGHWLKKHPVHRRILPENRATSWERVQMDLPRRLRQDRIDLYHAHFFRFPVDAPCKTVVTLHDAVQVLSPSGTVPPPMRRVRAHQLRVALRLADHLIASSRYTQQLLIEKLGIPSERISHISLGCPRTFHPIPRHRAQFYVKNRFHLSRPYLFSVGPLIPRKNHPLLIRAFQRRLWKEHDLVIAGKTDWWSERVLRMVRGDKTIRYLGPVSDGDLLNLYAAAKCFAYPSGEEGFGFPPLEAMACGTPVVASRCASIPEVVGKAGLLVKPGSAQQLASALEKLLKDARLLERLRERGFQRVKKFRWEDTAKKTLAVYQQVAKDAPSLA